MIHYRRILELDDEGLSIRKIGDSLGHGRPKVREVIEQERDNDLSCSFLTTGITNNFSI